MSDLLLTTLCVGCAGVGFSLGTWVRKSALHRQIQPMLLDASQEGYDLCEEKWRVRERKRLESEVY